MVDAPSEYIYMKQAIDLKNSSLHPDFCRWAFGCENEDRIWDDAVQLMNAWNQRHGKDVFLEQTNIIQDDLLRMGDLWALQGYPDGRQ